MCSDYQYIIIEIHICNIQQILGYKKQYSIDSYFLGKRINMRTGSKKHCPLKNIVFFVLSKIC